MSGGNLTDSGAMAHFQIEAVAEAVESYIERNRSQPQALDEFDRYGPETIKRFEEGAALLRRAAAFAERVDWLVSGDDSEETFHDRLDEQLRKV